MGEAAVSGAPAGRGGAGGQVAGERPGGERGQGERGDAEQTERGDAVRIPVCGDAARGHRRDRSRPEPAEHRARHDGRYGGGEGGAAVAEGGERQAGAGEGARAEPVDAGGKQEARRRRTEQQGTVQGSGPGGGEREPGGQSADGGGQQVRGGVLRLRAVEKGRIEPSSARSHM
ncbi:hypothetical protein GCM10018980_47680 [Streptomyces capoamus]|uniref:Uncharacterized protein n=1 Tax=Streptomyces capoamus TaxID=68183 RepID=A0A919KCL2_9ACTN|nr:hypothetical protein GCM10010501_45240 [Streptomyces libani subsp. rufus]GHG59674.1 hypothetical protein GCM10018980_47680 [Streptomyces capoamus]